MIFSKCLWNIIDQLYIFWGKTSFAFIFFLSILRNACKNSQWSQFMCRRHTCIGVT